LRNATIANLDLNAPAPHLILPAKDEKSRRGADIPLREDLAADLREYLGRKLEQERSKARLAGKASPPRLDANCAIVNIPRGLLRILNWDLVAAGLARKVRDPKTGTVRIDKRDARGRSIDLHALRTTFGTH
jgi:hypothetical protein